MKDIIRVKIVRKKLLRGMSIIPAFVIMIGIFIFSSQTAVESSGLSSGITEQLFDLMVHVFSIELQVSDRVIWLDLVETIVRKAAHMTEYAMLAIAVSFSFYVYGKRIVNLILWSEIICVLYAITDEIHQLFIPGRSGQAMDVLIDGCGAMIGCLIFAFFCRILANRVQRVVNQEK